MSRGTIPYGTLSSTASLGNVSPALTKVAGGLPSITHQLK